MWYKKKKSTTPKTRKKLEDKSESELIEVLDVWFSKYIRLRDTMPNGYCRCISCGKIKHIYDIDCGHYFSRRHLSTRFDERNANGECKYCNRFDSEHLEGYRDNLIRKIGENEFMKLKVLKSSTKHFLHTELIEMINYYKNESKRLSTEKGIRISM